MYDPIEFFDEMNIMKSEKEERYKLSVRIKKRMEKFFLVQLSQILVGAFLHSILTEEYIEELTGLYLAEVETVNPDMKLDRDVIAKATRFAKYIEDSTEKAYLNAIGNSRFELNKQMGTAITKEDVPEVVMRALSGDRALGISLNEANWIYNYETHQELVKSGRQTHTWMTMEDNKVRLTHAAADGQTVPINKPFIVGGYELMFPTDDSRGAPPQETIMCRCTEI